MLELFTTKEYNDLILADKSLGVILIGHPLFFKQLKLES